jgi:thiol-disulfide isomerase/thioredoxin
MKYTTIIYIVASILFVLTAITTLNYQRENFSDKNNKKVVFVFADWCGHCTKFKPEWKKFEKMCASHGIECEALNVDDSSNTEFIKNNEVNSFPTIIVFKSAKEKKLYDGPRTSTDLMEFVQSY